MLGNFTSLLLSSDFFKLPCSINSFRNTIRVSNSLDTDQARQFVWSNHGPNCLQWLSAENTAGKDLTLYLKETPFNAFANRVDLDQGLLCLHMEI